MSKIVIGTAHGRNVSFDIAALLVSRLLITANSGGGKSYLIRRLVEQGFGKVQEIIIDVAGEFATLREKFGFVLVGEHGETPADIRSAGLVAEKLLELKASAVCDLYSLKPHGVSTFQPSEPSAARMHISFASEKTVRAECSTAASGMNSPNRIPAMRS